MTQILHHTPRSSRQPSKIIRRSSKPRPNPAPTAARAVNGAGALYRYVACELLVENCFGIRIRQSWPRATLGPADIWCRLRPPAISTRQV